jgi:TetR/AcrR family transcriptional regulator, cholesterol catabolism regulator
MPKAAQLKAIPVLGWRRPDENMTSGLARKRQRANLEPSRAYAQRRRALITAAAEVFRAKGLSDTSLHDISVSIGVDRASLYYYFGSKEQLFRAVILESIEDVVTRAKGIAEGPGTGRRRLAALITLVVSSFEAFYPSLHVFMQEDMRRLKDRDDAATGVEARRLAQLADDYMAILEKLISAAVDGGEFRHLGSPRHVALIIQGAVNWMHRWFDPDDGPPAAELSELFVGVLLDGLVDRSVVTPGR